MKPTDIALGLFSAVLLLVSGALWVMFGLAGFRVLPGSAGVFFNPGPVLVVVLTLAGIALVAGALVIRRSNPEAQQRWQSIGVAVVLVLVAFVGVLLVLKANETWAMIDRRQISRLVVAAAAVAPIVVTGVALAYILRHSRGALAAIWMVDGTAAALIGLMTWMNWAVPVT